MRLPPINLLNAPRLGGRPKILILGHGRHGKDTVAEILRSRHQFRCASSSWAACESAVYPHMHMHGYADALECFTDRHNHRERWRDLILRYNTPDRTRLCREILKEHDIYVGMRSILEYKECRDLFDIIYYVSAAPRIPEDDPSMEITYDPYTMYYIDNSGRLSDLPDQI